MSDKIDHRLVVIDILETNPCGLFTRKDATRMMDHFGENYILRVYNKNDKNVRFADGYDEGVSSKDMSALIVVMLGSSPLTAKSDNPRDKATMMVTKLNCQLARARIKNGGSNNGSNELGKGKEVLDDN